MYPSIEMFERLTDVSPLFVFTPGRFTPLNKMFSPPRTIDLSDDSPLRTFHPRTFHPRTFHPSEFSPPRSFQPPEVSPPGSFTPRRFHPSECSPLGKFTPQRFKTTNILNLLIYSQSMIHKSQFCSKS